MASGALDGTSKRERETMLNLLRMPREPQKTAAAPQTTKGEAQRRRREREREEAKIPTVGG
jgi:hypothetical protein